MKNTDIKKSFYSNKKNVRKYEQLRFSRAGGIFVHNLEKKVFSDFLNYTKNRESILDLPTGTGRMLDLLVDELKFKKVYIADYSREMLSIATEKKSSPSIISNQEDIYSLSYKNNNFDAILSSRFFFHSDNQLLALKEMHRVLNPEGIVVFDTLSWSPRCWTSIFQNKLGGRIYTNSFKNTKKLIEKSGFKLIKHESILIMPSFFYNFIPSPMIKIISFIEKKYPNKLKTKDIWLIQKNA